MYVVPMFVRKMFIRIRLGLVVTNILIRTYVPYKHLHMNFSVQIFSYVLFSNELYPLRTFAFEQLRTTIHTNYFYMYFGPRIDAKAWVLRSGNKVPMYSKYLARFLFNRVHSKDKTIHHFLKSAGELYPHPNSA